MCKMDCNPQEEILKVPTLIREQGWSCSEYSEHYNIIVGGSDPSSPVDPNATGPEAITVYTGVVFNVQARGDDLKVRIGWPGQFTTSFSCDSAEQVIMWLGKMIAVASKDLKDRMMAHV